MAEGLNPYKPPSAQVADVAPGRDGDDLEALRQEHVKAEASIRSLGMLYLIGAVLIGVLSILFAVFMIAGLFSSTGTEFSAVDQAIVLVGWLLYAGLAALQWWLGRGLRRFSSSARIGATILNVLGLIGFPFGTLISAYFLYVLNNRHAKRIFAGDWQQVVAQTPHIRYRTPLWVWLILAAFILLFVLLVIVLAV